jgi:hypothetical protein
LVEVIETIFDNDSLIFFLTLPFAGCAVLAATIVAWFHGSAAPAGEPARVDPA